MASVSLDNPTSNLLKIRDAAYEHGDQWLQGIVIVIATELGISTNG